MLSILFTPLANWLASFLEVKSKYCKADVIMVLSGSMYPDGSLNSLTNERLMQGINLYRQKRAPKLMFVGASILAPTKSFIHATFDPDQTSGLADVDDASQMKKTAVQIGVPEIDIILDTTSTHTYENIRNAKQLMEQNGFQSCLIVTSGTHGYRVRKVAQELGLNFSPAFVPNYDHCRIGASDRFALFQSTLREFVAIVIYKMRGWV